MFNNQKKNVYREEIHKWILYVSSCVPLYLLFITNRIMLIFRNDYNKEDKFIDSILILFLSIISISSVIYLKVVLKRSKPSVFAKVKKIKEWDSLYALVIYLLLYFLVGISLYNRSNLIYISFLMVIKGMIYTKRNLIYINPALLLMRYKFYNLKLEVVPNKEIIEGVAVVRWDSAINEGDLLFTTKKTSVMIAEKKHYEE